jgi:hypothetical protein
MKLFQAADAIELTGLTRNQLREWTNKSRRGFLVADVAPNGPGRHALYSWQTLLVLRLLLSLQSQFAIDVGAWSPVTRKLRQLLENVSFHSLWGMRVVFSNSESVKLSDEPLDVCAGQLVLPLDPHLEFIATKLALPHPGQLSLFAAMVVSK